MENRASIALEAMSDAVRAIASERSVDPVLQTIVDVSRELGGARYAALGVPDGQGAFAKFITAGMSDELIAKLGPLPRTHGMLGAMLDADAPYRTADIKQDPRFRGWWPHAHPSMASFLGVPISSPAGVLGAIYLTDKEGADEFTAEDERLIEMLAAHAAIAIENARLYEQSERVSVLEERHRIGMDLHDGAIQALYALGLMLEDAAARIEREPGEARVAVERGVDRLNAAIADLRGYVLGLRPVRGSDRPLTESLPTLAAQARSNALLDVDVAVSPEAAGALDAAGREAAFYIAADALGNVARHARAKRASLRLFLDESAVVLEVADDGVGFDYQRVTDGHGLRNMRERAFSAGGTLSVESAPGQGSRMRFEVPVREEAVT